MSDRNRRIFLGALGVGMLALAGTRSGWFQALLPASDLNFQPMQAPEGYRILKTGAISFAQGVPVFGLDQEKPEGLIAAEKSIANDLEIALFGPGNQWKNATPVAYFFDYQCPICRRLTPRLLASERTHISWHDLAGLGPSSDLAARAAIAARAQGAYDAFHERLMRSRFQATPAYVKQLAQSVDIDPARLLADMESPETNRRMWTSRALASLFGMAGTPGLVVGRSVIIGDISTRDLNAVIAQEQAG